MLCPLPSRLPLRLLLAACLAASLPAVRAQEATGTPSPARVESDRNMRDRIVEREWEFRRNKLPPEAGRIEEFEAPLSEQLRKLAGGAKLSEVTSAACVVAVPKDFDPKQPRPILVVSGGGGRSTGSSRTAAMEFAKGAIDAGWIVLAADPAQKLVHDDDTNGLRYALMLGALDHLRKQWPGMTRWPRAYGGLYEGAARSAWLAAISTELGQPSIGLFMAACNKDVATRALKETKAPKETFLKMPIFLSSGMEDEIATPAQHRNVKKGIDKTGFANVKLETFPGGHVVQHDHVEAALKWFLEAATAASTPAPAKAK